MLIDNMLNISLQGQGFDKYPAKSHARRVAERLHAKDGLIVLAATKAANWPNSDMPAPFRQDRYFYYMTGCNEPDCLVSYHIKTDILALWLPPIDKARVVWYGRGSTTEEALEKYDIDEAHYIEASKAPSSDLWTDFWRTVANSALARVREWHQIWNQELSPTCRNVVQKHALYTTRVPSPDALYHAIDACRVIKDEHEIDLIRRANVITAEAHISVMKSIHSFTSEAEVDAAYMQVCIARKAKEQAYDVIAGSGPNAAELHYSDNVADFGDGQTVVLDAGCEVDRYASDVTRTLPINAKSPGCWPSTEAAQIYALVEKIQESCIGRMMPGNQFIENYWHAHEMVVEGLLELGIFTGGTVEEIFKAGTSRAFLPHGLGHHVGLEVHDVSPVPHPPFVTFNSSSGPTRRRTELVMQEKFAEWKPEWSESRLSSNWLAPITQSQNSRHSMPYLEAAGLEPGMVVTVEPGIYFNRYLLDNFFLNKKEHQRYINKDVLDQYMQVGGVRIEDDILITRDGYENLTTAPKGKRMLDLIRKSAEGPRA
ncbi:uncharacterized protein MYCFIDRAFT_214057 [Pseudocercospora fijiensis CIRAD86]|uniref:Xaa-Pro aminopeptidase n=1 Tax=Pseudocercospora fijiensis (strain CIRAD86) TaxID=383855 RepID=M3A481_PSEFD|nr:uncharacterized protein MYCFIDRAFT_214057 [Pseudocercospora fijiensis CIRAD86]EME85914.1 hypothetical protein MYCFIDRAFT_214057 [Pseudocercospora fijiensis CIRAD86]